jgi:hypothetical protein
MKKTNWLKIFSTFIAIVIVSCFILPWLGFFIGYAFGWLSNLVIGDLIIRAFSCFGLTISREQIPLISGLFGWMSWFFTSSTKISSSNIN